MTPSPSLDGAPQARRAANWRRYLRFWGPRASADVDDELRFHIEMRVRDYVERGFSEEAARAATLKRLGDLVEARAACVTITTRRQRRMTRAQLVDAFVQDLQFAFRTLGRQKGWTVVAVLTLALGIGANTAVFSVVNNLLLHPLRYPDADRLTVIFQLPNQGNTTGVQVRMSPNVETIRTWQQGSRAFQAIEAYSTTDMLLRPDKQSASGGEVTQSVNAAIISPSFPRFAGRSPLIGRMFGDADITAGGRVALLSEGLWRGRFASSDQVLGRTVTLDSVPYVVIGVLPANLMLPRHMSEAPDIWLPLDLGKKDIQYNLWAIGRLQRGTTVAAAAKELDSLQARMSGVTVGGKLPFVTTLVRPGEMVGFRDALLMLSGAVALVLLIACANVAHLLLARSAARQRELAIRAAIGAGRARLLRQLLTESLVLAAVGCAGGAFLGWLGVQAMAAVRPDSLSELDTSRVDTMTLVVTVALSAATGVIFGLIGAIQASRSSTNEALKSGALSTSHSRRQQRLRALLVVSEMALSTTLLVGATLLVRSVAHLQNLDPGFAPEGLYTMQVTLPGPGYQTTPAQSALLREIAERARTIPGVQGVTLASGAPPSRNFLIGALQVEGDKPPRPDERGFISYTGVEPGYFRLMGIRIVEGTAFTDTSSGAAQVIINEGMARQHWPGKSALGRRLRIANVGKSEWRTIVGVAANASTGGLTSEASEPMLYMPPSSIFRPAIVLRTTGSGNPMPQLRALVASIDPALAPPTISSVAEMMAKSVAGPRFTMLLLGVFTVLALVLAAVGLYGVMAYSVAQRTREIGIRIALGASTRHIGRRVVRQGAVLALLGVVIGLVGANWATRLIERMLYGVPRTDPMSFVVGGVLLLATALLACVVPMRRAVRVDPVIAMHAE